MKLNDILKEADDDTNHAMRFQKEVFNGTYRCSHSQLKTIADQYIPFYINGNFECNANYLTSLKGSPRICTSFNCSNNNLKSLEEAPSEISGDFQCSMNELTSLKDIHKIIKKMDGKFLAYGNPIKSHVLGVLLIDGCKELFLEMTDVTFIVNKYLPNHEGMKGVLKCQEELFAADLDEYAQL